MAKQTLDELILTADDVLWGRVDQARSRIETRIERAQSEGRDFTERERQLSEADRDELVLLRDAVEIRSARREQGDEIERTQRETEQRQGQIAQAMQIRSRDGQLSPLCVSAANLELLERARAEFRNFTVLERFSTPPQR